MAKVLVYSKDYCPYCDRAKNLLKNKNVEFEEVNLQNDPDKLMALKKQTGMMTVPQIFINDTLVGGFTELQALENSGELDNLLS